MDEKEIIAALENCTSGKPCKLCPSLHKAHCMTNVMEEALDLIKRQQKRIYHYECSTKNLIKEIMHLKNTMNAIIEQLEAEVESSDKYIREYDDSEFQKAWNEGLRNALEIVKDGAADDR